MIFRQVFDNNSSTYTYLIASAKGREAVISDPVIENGESGGAVAGPVAISVLKELIQ